MKTIQQRYLLIPLFSVTLLIHGCSKHETVAVTDVHAYNTNFGLNPNPVVDAEIASEIDAQNRMGEMSNRLDEHNDLVMEPGTFLEEDYVPTPPKITYKYKFDTKFYDTPEWRSAD